MLRNKLIFVGLLFGLSAYSAFAAGGELAKIQNQIKKTEQQNKQIEQQLQTSNKNVEQTKKTVGQSG